MLRSKKINFLSLVFLGCLIAGSTEAKTFHFGNKAFELNSVSSDTSPDIGMRSPELTWVIRQTLLNSELPFVTLVDAETASQIENLGRKINQTAKDANLIVEQEKVLEFDPGQNGQSLDLFALYQLLIQSSDIEELPVFVSFPPTRLSQTNNLGVNELVATGESDFSGSPKNRIHNIKVGSQKFNGIIVKPQEEFSFNKFLGPVEAENGFLPELVIKKTGLVPELGGGLCQVSSTAFRAAMNAGVPITERRNHSFAVRYYAPQGTDATIYPGATDFRFINDLGSHLLIATRIEGNKLYFDFYGTKDDRQVAFDGPYQYDKKADGSMKAVWTRTVAYNGEEKKQTFRSTYLPPALFTKTNEPSIPNPTSNPPTQSNESR